VSSLAAGGVATAARPCPYRGLQPYTEADRAYFFGRERDREIVIANLYASPLTVFYGASGTGKSSVLLAGVVPRLQAERRGAVAVLRGWQGGDVEGVLKAAVSEAVADRLARHRARPRSLGAAAAAPDLDAALPLDEFLRGAARLVRGPVFLIFDQFEEYFLYHAGSGDREGFEASFARAVNRQDVDAAFLLSLREDGLSQLDRFQGRIPHLLANMLRLDHLGRDAAREAIRKPLDVHNARLPAGASHVGIEDGLVEAILEAARPGTLSRAAERDATDRGPDDRSQDRVETPLLQMVLTRLWAEEAAEGSSVLRLATFRRLGGAEGIASSHLDKAIPQESAEAPVAARVLRFLVTPSGTKIAHEAAALASWADLTEAEVQPVLTHLAAPGLRVLRTVDLPGHPPRYEIFHDVLAPAVVDWRRRYAEHAAQEQIREEARTRREEERREEARRQETERGRRLRYAVAILSVLAAVIGALALFAWRAQQRAEGQARRAASASQAATDAQREAQQRLDRILQGLNLKRAALSGDAATLAAALDSSSRDRSIVFGARATPRGYDASPGRPMYFFELFPQRTSPPGDLANVALVTYKMDHPTFQNTLMATGPDKKFVASYNGWGCLRQVIAIVEYSDPDRPPAIAAFDMCEALGW
jgi:hypothetical protein